jgi:hypothetical protein
MDGILDIYNLTKFNQEDTNNINKNIMNNEIETIVVFYQKIKSPIHC